MLEAPAAPLKGAALIKDEVTRLPDKPGVYRMMGEEGEVLYVGKARSLKKRVIQYAQGRFHTQRIALEVTDNLGRTITVRADTITTWPSFGFWPNQMVLHNCARIECEGLVTHGEIYDILSNDYMQHRAHVLGGSR